jgi:hypothetical protein
MASRLRTRPFLLYSGVGFALATGAANTATPVAYVAAILVAMTVVSGPVPIATGGTAGVLVHDLFYGAAGYWTLVVAVWIATYAAGIAWLSSGRGESTDGQKHPAHRSVLAYAGTGVTAGVYATGLAAWTAAVSGGQRFYTIVGAYLPGIAVATVAITSLWWFRSKRSERDVQGRTADGSEGESRAGGVGPTLALLAMGIAWLGGGTLLDAVAHDLSVFATESQLLAYVEGLLGDGSTVATVGRIGLVGIYRYGEAAILLSAPVAVVAATALYVNGRSTRQREGVIQR